MIASSILTIKDKRHLAFSSVADCTICDVQIQRLLFFFLTVLSLLGHREGAEAYPGCMWVKAGSRVFLKINV